ncbi:MAG: GrpB family protein, partial [Rubripirellula sp.]|nr:GrpB family protein [Rubripirellula sp.]
MHYDPRWRQEFEQTRSSILSSTEGWVTGVEHIGSTAISGLIA